MLRTSQPGETGLGPHTPSTCVIIMMMMIIIIVIITAAVRLQASSIGPSDF